ncbi:MAG TPA: amino acid racemase [bacterium]|nr:amino acid racemase [bacterium]
MTTPSTVRSRKRRATAPRRRAGARRDEKVVGVLGGMGPLATADFYAKLVRLTPARTDQDHLRVIIDSNPKIPDRTAGLEGKGPDPTPHLVATAQALERAGAEVIAMPCNSAHAYLPAIMHSVRIPVLDIMEEVAAAAAALTPRPRAIGLLATPGTVRARLYHRALASRGIAVVEPTAVEEEDVHTAINAVKAGDLGPAARARLHGVARALIRRGAAAIVLGCTELPLVMSSKDVSVALLDGTEILAAAALREALPPGRLTQEFSPLRRRAGPRTSSRKHHAGGSLPARRL